MLQLDLVQSLSLSGPPNEQAAFCSLSLPKLVYIMYILVSLLMKNAVANPAPDRLTPPTTPHSATKGQIITMMNLLLVILNLIINIPPATAKCYAIEPLTATT